MQNGYLFKAKFPSELTSLEYLIINPAIVDCLKPRIKTKGKSEFWSPPPLDFMKLNVDGAMKCYGSSGGIGGAIRNSNGALIVESISSGPPILVELLALKFGLLLFGSRSEYKLSQVVSLGATRSSIFRRIPRNINLQADILAKKGKNNRGFQFYLPFISKGVCFIE
ncbi:hypothetical protein GQ457_11G011650 [Hibiscus cannabinus]